MGEKKRKKEEPWMDIKTQKCVYKMYKIGLLEKDHKKKIRLRELAEVISKFMWEQGKHNLKNSKSTSLEAIKTWIVLQGSTQRD